MTDHKYPKELLDEVEQCIDNDEFEIVDSEKYHGSEEDGVIGYTITTKTWRFVVVEFGPGYHADLPPGIKAYTGTAVKTGCVIKLPDRLAEKAYKKAAYPETT